MLCLEVAELLVVLTSSFPGLGCDVGLPRCPPFPFSLSLSLLVLIFLQGESCVCIRLCFCTKETHCVFRVDFWLNKLELSLVQQGSSGSGDISDLEADPGLLASLPAPTNLSTPCRSNGSLLAELSKFVSGIQQGFVSFFFFSFSASLLQPLFLIRANVLFNSACVPKLPWLLGSAVRSLSSVDLSPLSVPSGVCIWYLAYSCRVMRQRESVFAERFWLFCPVGRTKCISMELLLTVHEKGSVGSIVAFPFGVKPCKGCLIGFHVKDSLKHMVPWGRNGLGVGAEAYFPAYVAVASP